MPSHTAPLPGVRRFLKSNALTLAAASGYIIALGVALASFGVVNSERAASTMSRYGNAVAEDLAHHAVDPLLRRDRIQLGLLTNRVAARPEVRRIAIHTVDEKLFVVAGSTASGSAPTYIRPITVQDTVAGELNVMLNADSFAVPITRVIADSWQFVLAGLALTVFSFYFGRRWGSRGAAARGSAKTSLQTPMKEFVVAADLPRQSASEVAEREALLANAMTVAQRVSNLYAGHAAALADAGIVLVFPTGGSNDRAFEVMCAAWLVRRLLASEPGTGKDAGHAFRYGVDFSETGVPVHDGTVKASAVSNVLLLASLAGAGELVLGQTAYEALDHPDRLHLEELENPAVEALSSAVVIPCGKVCGIAVEYDALLARQSEVLARSTTDRQVKGEPAAFKTWPE